jgi:hypothetical protein
VTRADAARHRLALVRVRRLARMAAHFDPDHRGGRWMDNLLERAFHEAANDNGQGDGGGASPKSEGSH